MTARLTATQSGAGNISPENARPIAGKAQLTIAHSGENTENTYAVALPETLYGLPGAPDIVSVREGLILQNTGHIALTGTETEWLWGFSGTQPAEATLARFLLPGLNISIHYKGICSHFPWIVSPNPSTQKTECVGGYASDRTVYFYVLKSRLAGWSDSWTNTQKVNAFKSWLSAQSTAGAPLQMAYEMVTPKTLTFQPTVILALPGLNILSVDGGEAVAALNLHEYLLSANGGSGIITETDPTVPDWAKQPDKPAYTAEEITGAVPATRRVNEKALDADITLTAQDVGAAPENHAHAQYLTEEADPTVPEWAKSPQKPVYGYGEIENTPALTPVATSGSYNDLSDKPEIPTLPTLAAVATSGSYNDLSGRPIIPSTPGEVNAYPAAYVQYSTTDLTPGVSPLTTGSMYLVYE